MQNTNANAVLSRTLQQTRCTTHAWRHTVTPLPPSSSEFRRNASPTIRVGTREADPSSTSARGHVRSARPPTALGRKYHYAAHLDSGDPLYETTTDPGSRVFMLMHSRGPFSGPPDSTELLDFEFPKRSECRTVIVVTSGVIRSCQWRGGIKFLKHIIRPPTKTTLYPNILPCINVVCQSKKTSWRGYDTLISLPPPVITPPVIAPMVNLFEARLCVKTLPIIVI